jgi:hypothetical protein
LVILLSILLLLVVEYLVVAGGGGGGGGTPAPDRWRWRWCWDLLDYRNCWTKLSTSPGSIVTIEHLDLGGPGGYLAGGGSGAPPSPSPGETIGPDAGGGGYGYYTGFSNPLVNGRASTGGGGGGEWGSADAAGLQGAGGSGIVVVRYQIAQLTATAKATGGAISYYSGKTIHTFTSSGTFATLSNWNNPDTVEYLVVAGGGGGGGANDGGGGGAGGVVPGTTTFTSGGSGIVLIAYPS